MIPTLLAADVRARLGERKTRALAVAYALAVLAAPKLLEKPPPHLLDAARTWFGTDAPGALFLYVWTDLAMNKLVVLAAITLGSGVLVGEAASRSLVLWLSKPVLPSQLYVVRVGSAALVGAGLYLAAQVLGLLWFPLVVDGFDPVTFAASAVVHVGALVSSVLLTGLLAVVTGRQLPAALVAVGLLFTLVGATFLGVYDPAWAHVAAANPFTQASSVVTHQGHLDAGAVIAPILILLALDAALLALGARAARRMTA
jgi:ABC-2 type transport system permease protein